MSQYGDEEKDHHKELTNLGTATKLAYWRYGRRLGGLGAIAVVAAFVTGNRDDGWWHLLPQRWTTVLGWTCTILFFVFLYMVIRERPVKQPCRRCNAPFRKITFVAAHRVGSFDQIVMRCEACGYQWLWEVSS